MIPGVLAVSLISLIVPTYSVADNANPPKLISVEQVSRGPYSIGDVATFRINYSGGNPGLNRAKIEVGSATNTCLSNIYDHALYGTYVNQSEIAWYKAPKSKPANESFLDISGVVLPCLLAFQRKSAQITDETGLSDGLSGVDNSVFEIVASEDIPQFLTPAGEVKPSKINDGLSLTSLPASVKAGKSFRLPRLTKNGVPVYYLAENDRDSRIKSCRVAQAFPGDIGGTLYLSKPGNCRLTVMPMLTDKFNYPKISYNKLKKIKTDPSHVSYFVISVVK
jgi:hypothetical protein